MKARKTGGRLRIAAWLMGAALLCLTAACAAGEKSITLTFAGDCTLGSTEERRGQEDSFDAVAQREGYDFFFKNYVDIFEKDDLTMVNLEGVFQDHAANEYKGKTFRFRGQTDYVRILKDASIELCGLGNNHSGDYGATGLKNTKETLEGAGIHWCHVNDYYLFEKDGIRIAFFSLAWADHLQNYDKVRTTIQELKESGEANAVVLMFHSGTEYDPHRNSNKQEKAEQMYINAGADLILMSHAHVVQGIHIMNHRTTFYCLGNFVFGGNHQVKTKAYKDRVATPLYTLVVQAKLYFSDDGTYKGQQMTLIPGFVTSTTEFNRNNMQVNNYQPIRLSIEEAECVLEAIQYDTPWFEIPKAQMDGRGYAIVKLNYEPATDEDRETGAAGDGPEAAPPKPYRDIREIP